jgi:hypothetical protein
LTGPCSDKVAAASSISKIKRIRIPIRRYKRAVSGRRPTKANQQAKYRVLNPAGLKLRTDNTRFWTVRNLSQFYEGVADSSSKVSVRELLYENCLFYGNVKGISEIEWPDEIALKHERNTIGRATAR